MGRRKRKGGKGKSEEKNEKGSGDRCSHADSLFQRKIAIPVKAATKCADCGSPSPWICAECGFSGCGRSEKQHAMAHFESTGHAVCIHPPTRRVWCYGCDDEVTTDLFPPYENEADAYISKLRSLGQSAVGKQPSRAPASPSSPSAGEGGNGICVSARLPGTGVVSPHGPGIMGLPNFGNTCYLNSVLQVLLQCDPLVGALAECPQQLRDMAAESSGGGGMVRGAHLRLVAAAAALVGELWVGDADEGDEEDDEGVFVTGLDTGSGNPPKRSPVGDRDPSRPLSHLVRACAELNPSLRGFGQQDSQEFLRTVLDGLHEATARNVPTVARNNGDGKNVPAFTPPPGHPSLAGTDGDRVTGVLEDPDSAVTRREWLERREERERAKGKTEATTATSTKRGKGENGKPNQHGGGDKSDKSNKNKRNKREKRGLRRGSESPPARDGDDDASGRNSAGNGTGSSRSGSRDTGADSDSEDSDDEGPSFRPWRTSFVSDAFEGCFLSEVRCSECGGRSRTRDKFYDVSVSVPSRKRRAELEAQQQAEEQQLAKNGNSDGKGNGSDAAGGSSNAVQNQSSAATNQSCKPGGGWFSGLTSWFTSAASSMQTKPVPLELCLRNFVSPEPLTGDERVTCDNCKKRTESVKTMNIHRLPDYLCLHVKRFRHDTYFGSKVTTPVAFPTEGLDMSPYAVSGAGPAMYDLVGLVRHSGSLSSGHYTSYVRHRVTGGWWFCDDERVRECGSVSGDGSNATGVYVMVYRRRWSTSTVEGVLRSLGHPHIPPGAESGSDNDTDNDDEADRDNGKGQKPRPVTLPPAPADGTVLIPRLWVCRFASGSTPGPLDNTCIGCVHGTCTVSSPDDVVTVPRGTYESLVARFGGGPLVSGWAGAKCDECEREREKLDLRREGERCAIAELDSKAPEPGSPWYVLSSAWLKSWRAFIRGNADEPGPIDNGTLLTRCKCGVKTPSPVRGVALPWCPQCQVPRPGLKRVTDFKFVNGPVWEKLIEMYGGGPPIPRRTLDLYAPHADEATPEASRSGSDSGSDTATASASVSSSGGRS